MIYELLNNTLIIPIITAIVGGIVTTLYYFHKWNQKDKRTGEKAFKTLWVSTKILEYVDLSGRKEFSEKEPSTQSHLLRDIQEQLDLCKNILLIGEPMAGKTYFTVNYLKKLDNSFVLIPDSDNFDERYEFIPEAPQGANHKIVLIDDVYLYLNAGIKRLPNFIENCIENGYTVWLNTITGPEFETVRDNFPHKLLATFCDILIPSNLTETEALQIAKSEGKNELPNDFDGNIGSIFYPISQIKARYEKLDVLGKLLLLVIKQLYLVGIYKMPSTILKSNVRKLFYYYEPHISAETLSKSIEELIKNGFLLKNQDPLNIRFEEKYLKNVVEPELKVKMFMHAISEVFPKNIATYTQAMQAAYSYEEAVKLYNEMLTNELQPGIRPFCVLIRKADDSDIGMIWLKEMDKMNIPIDDYIFTALLKSTKGDTDKKERLVIELEKRKIQVDEKINMLLNAPKVLLDKYAYCNLMNLSGNYNRAQEIFNAMKRNNISPDSVCYNILIKLSNDFQKGMDLFNEMVIKKILPDNYTYGILIHLSSNYIQGRKLLEKMISEGLIPNSAIYGTLMKLSNDFKTCWQLLKEMKSNNIPITHARYGFVINLSPNLTEGEKVVNECINDGIVLTEAEYGTLMNKAISYDDKIKVLSKMKKLGLKPTIEIYGTLINLCESYEIGRKHFVEMINQKIEPNAEVYGTLMKLSNNYSKAKQLFSEMKAKNILPNVITYGTLINLSTNFKEAKEIYDEMINSNVSPNIEIYGTLINLSPNYQTGKQLFYNMIEKGICPNSISYGTLMNLSNDYEIAKQLFDKMLKNKIPPTSATYGTLMNLSNDFELAKEHWEEMLKRNIKPDAKTYGTLMNLSSSFINAKKIFDEMITNGIKPDTGVYGTLMNLTRNYLNRKKIFTEMIEKNINPNVEIYTMLIRSSPNIETGRMHLQQMLNKKIKPNSWTYNSIIWLLKHNYQEALSIMEIEMVNNNVKPDVATYTQLMNISNDFNIALGLLERMCKQNISPNNYTYKTLTALGGNDIEKLNKLKSVWANCRQKIGLNKKHKKGIC